MNARLQGLEDNFLDAVDKVTTNVGLSGVVSQKAVVAKMTELIDSGVAYNVELRAFLAETAENIASTFDALNPTLQRLIRIQQADTTAARLGMEASLLQLLNKTFKDSSYLSDVYDSVSSAIIDANSQMSRDDSLSFEYTLQKWLGALYSMGMSDTAVTTIAEGINYLATGNVAALNNNDALQTLLAMSASRTEKSYADLLTGNLTAKDTNNLLKAMVEYLAEIANSQTNFVTKSAYADLFNMSITDLSTFANLGDKTINQLYNTTQDYDSMMREVSNQLSSVSSRLNISQVIDTVIENALTSAATGIGSSAGLYGTWKALNIVNDLTGGIKIPAIQAMGWGFASELNILEIAKVGIAGLSLLGSLGGAAFNGSLFGSSDISKWGYDEYNKRGDAIVGISGGFSSGTSLSESLGVGSSSGEDIKETTLNDQKEESMEDNQTSEEEMEEGKNIQKYMYETLIRIETLLDPNRIFYSSIAGVVTSKVPSSTSVTGGASSTSSTLNAVRTITSLQNDIEYNRAYTEQDASTMMVSVSDSVKQSSKGLIDVVNANNESLQNLDVSSAIALAVEHALLTSFSKISENSHGNPLYVTPVNGYM